MKRFLFFLSALSLLSSCIFLPDDSRQQFFERGDTRKGFAYFETAKYPEALKYLTAAAEKGDTDAQYAVGMIYLYGLAGEKHTYAAQKWLTLAARSGQRAAQEQLAFLYRDDLTPLYSPIDSYYWFSVIIGDHPEYRDKMQNMEWILRSRGLLATAQTLPRPTASHYKGVNYNSLFPLR